MLRVYERVSSTKQRIDSQHEELERWARGQTDDLLWYPADKATGTNLDRPSFNRIIRELQRGDTLVVWRLDRLGRTASGLTKLFDDFLARGINLVSVRDMIDLSTAAGRLMACVIASVAAYETEIRGERIKAGIEARRLKIERGEITNINNGGRPKGQGKVTPAKRQLILEKKAEGWKLNDIASLVSVSRCTVCYVLQSATAS